MAKRRLIFSMFFPMEQESSHYVWENDPVLISKLQARQKLYATYCGADYKVVTEFSREYLERIEQHHFTMYEIVNFYKFWLLQQFTQDYDQVIYFDTDVVPLKLENYFEHHCFSYIHLKSQTAQAIEKLNYNKWMKLTYNNDGHLVYPRSYYTKFLNTRAMLFIHDGRLSETHDVLNTGIIATCYDRIHELDYFGPDFDTAINIMTEAKTEEYEFPERIYKNFAYDNETLLSYYYQTKELTPWHEMSDDWHCLVKKNRKPTENTILAHVIDKNFKPYRCLET